MKIYCILNNQYIESYFYDSYEGAVEIEVPDDFNKNIQFCRVENGVLVYDQERETFLKAKEEEYKNQPQPKKEVEILREENTILKEVQTQMSTDFQALTDLLAQQGVI